MRILRFAGTVLCVVVCCAGAIAQPVRDVRAARDMLEIVRLDSTIHLDIHYARADNFMGRPMYPQARAFLQRPAAEALLRVHKAMKQKGYGLVIFDGYRPWAVTKKFWDETPPDKRKFVANPAKGSRHNRGCAVDLSLYSLRLGAEVEMPSPYDEFSQRAASDYAGGTSEQRAGRDLLRKAMVAEGFTIEPSEWWHFDYWAWSQYPILDVSFEVLDTVPR
jgi:zinc D-Ala-D-Ala dipeptidase